MTVHAPRMNDPYYLELRRALGHMAFYDASSGDRTNDHRTKPMHGDYDRRCRIAHTTVQRRTRARR